MTLRLVSWNVERVARHVGSVAREPGLLRIFEAYGEPDVFCIQELGLVARASNLVPRATAPPPVAMTAPVRVENGQKARARGRSRSESVCPDSPV